MTKLVAGQLGRPREQHRLYEAVTDYVRDGYNQAMREKKSHVGFLMILMQRLVTSSTRAIATTLEKRLGPLRTPPAEPDAAAAAELPVVTEEEWGELDPQEQYEALLKTRLAALRNERGEVEHPAPARAKS